ncbi:hypothetical protein [Planomonospora parontospora]|uniref:hypothetical protein n=1 Tax=Planomonospora parontospora TaxID=58119 RepID=UPI0017873514|nr:hypothetical protein [Planomonospora parontospora]
MNSSTGTGNAVLGPGQWRAWVHEHGAHLLDYAVYHLGPERATAAVAAAVAACGVRSAPENAPENVSVRARLLAVLRRDCFTRPGHRDGYVPGGGPGMPDVLLIEQGWGLADPLGTEALRLMFRHELTSEDLAYVLALPVEEVDRLATRTQDIIETLVSALDGLAHGRPTCPELRALAASAFPGDRPEPSGGPGHAREELLAHIVRCPACTRPINIRYTVPQMISHPPLPPLTPEAGTRILDAVPEASAPPAAAEPPRAGLPAPRRGTAPYAKPYPSRAAKPYPPRSAPSARPAPSQPSAVAPPRGERTVPLAAPVPPAAPAPPARPEHDTPLYDALLSQIASRAGQANLDVPLSIPSSTGPPGTARDPGHPHDGPRARFAEALTWAGDRFRTTTLKIIVIVVAGTAGTLTGMNLLGPIGAERPAGTLPSSRPQAAVTVAPSPPTAFPEESALAAEGTLAARVPLPVEVTLDEYGRGSMTLTVTSGDPLAWRAAAPGLVVSPSTGTLERGDKSVITLRALRVRHWCGPAPFVTVPLTLHGPDDSISTTVRWRTC